MAKSKRRRRMRWFAIALVGTLIMLMGAAWQFWSSRHVAQWQLLRSVVDADPVGPSSHEIQMLAWNLAILGRDHEVRTLDFFPQYDRGRLQVDPDRLELDPKPWRDALQTIAAKHRLVMIMEDHSVSKHREMIGATLPLFRDAGFTHYAAEAIGESTRSLSTRGFPSIETGVYTSDPQFGNVLRRAMGLGFQTLGYDFRPFSHEAREQYAAGRLAELFENNASTKLIVHAGFAHVYKHETDIGQRWLASLLWEKSGIEPFTIWQWSAMHENHEYRVVAKALSHSMDFREPVLLMPPPKFERGPANIPDVDAILVHPPDISVAPNQRTVLFPDEMDRISGRWLGSESPVIIAAYPQGEPISAIPLDQVMLREGEREFSLWVPGSAQPNIIVFDQHGRLESTTTRDHDGITIEPLQ